MKRTYIKYDHPKLNEMEHVANKLIRMNFNKIHLHVVEDNALPNDSMMGLVEHIEYAPCDNHKIRQDDCEECWDVDSNYPIWNWLFEIDTFDWLIKDNIEQIQELGFVVIEPFNNFSWMLGFRGCGYSFYDAHWIPLFIDVFGDVELKKLYEVGK